MRNWISELVSSNKAVFLCFNAQHCSTLVLDGNLTSVENMDPSLSGRLLTKLQLVMVCSAPFDAVAHMTALLLPSFWTAIMLVYRTLSGFITNIVPLAKHAGNIISCIFYVLLEYKFRV